MAGFFSGRVFSFFFFSAAPEIGRFRRVPPSFHDVVFRRNWRSFSFFSGRAFPVVAFFFHLISFGGMDWLRFDFPSSWSPFLSFGKNSLLRLFPLDYLRLCLSLGKGPLSDLDPPHLIRLDGIGDSALLETTCVVVYWRPLKFSPFLLQGQRRLSKPSLIFLRKLSHGLLRVPPYDVLRSRFSLTSLSC